MGTNWLYGIILLLAAIPAANTLTPSFAHDTWWHLRIGQIIAETGVVPQTDPLSQYGQREQVPWRAYSWLFELAIDRAHRLGGDAGVMWFRTLLALTSTATLFAFVFRQCGLNPTGILVATALAFVVMVMAPERPWHITIALTTLTLWATTAVRAGAPIRCAWWLLPAFVLWANTHIQYVLGWGILGLACLFPGRADRRGVVVLTLACVLATAINPYHFWLFQVIWEYATQAAPRMFVQELSPPELLSRWTVAAGGLGIYALVQWSRRRPYDAFELGLLVAGAILASRMFRDSWFGALVAAALIRTPDAELARARRVFGVVLCVAFVFLALRLANQVGWVGPRDYAAEQAKVFPVHAVEYLRANRPPGPIYNDFDWGGYIAWELPEYPVSFDGRTNLYGNEKIRQSFETWSTVDGWQRDPDFANCRIVIAQQHRVLTQVLREQSARWALVHEDAIACVFVRKPE